MEDKSMPQIHGIIFDIDGTLVESNDAHANAWVEAMKAYGHDVPFGKIRPFIGEGGDKVLPETIGVDKESEEGQKISNRRKEIFQKKYLPTLHAFPDAKTLIEEMRKHGLKIAVATSSEEDEAKALLNIAGADGLIDDLITSKDAKKSKPSSDVMQVALQRIGFPPDEVMMVGDTAYDIEAAKKVGVGTIAFRSGGWKDADLAGALAIYDGPADLLAHYRNSPIAQRDGSQ
jgi:HAD superfamily hydrolase (TIGR01509 family)